MGHVAGGIFGVAAAGRSSSSENVRGIDNMARF
jgi:hypothetical protein